MLAQRTCPSVRQQIWLQQHSLSASIAPRTLIPDYRLAARDSARSGCYRRQHGWHQGSVVTHEVLPTARRWSSNLTTDFSAGSGEVLVFIVV